jgi:hypothetical protein
MRKKQYIRQIEMSWQYNKAKEIANCSPEDYQRKYKFQLHPFPYYTKSRLDYLFDKLALDLRFEKKTEIEYGIWGRIKVTISGGIGRHWSLVEPTVGVSLHFLDLRGTPRAIKDTNIPDNANLKRPEQWIHQLLATMLFKEGYVAELQLRRDCLKNEVHKHYQPLMDYKNPVAYDEDKSIKKIEKRYNVKSYLSVESTVKVVNQIGKQTVLKTLTAYDNSWFDYFDGDVDELEEQYYGSLEENTIYV